jgi:hypothetical protein
VANLHTFIHVTPVATQLPLQKSSCQPFTIITEQGPRRVQLTERGTNAGGKLSTVLFCSLLKRLDDYAAAAAVAGASTVYVALGATQPLNDVTWSFSCDLASGGGVSCSTAGSGYVYARMTVSVSSSLPTKPTSPQAAKMTPFA